MSATTLEQVTRRVSERDRERERAAADEFAALVRRCADAEHRGRTDVDPDEVVAALDRLGRTVGELGAAVAAAVDRLRKQEVAARQAGHRKARQAAEKKLAAADADLEAARQRYDATYGPAADAVFPAVEAEAEAFLAAAAVCEPGGRRELAATGRELLAAARKAANTARLMQARARANPAADRPGDEAVESKYGTLAGRLEVGLVKHIQDACDRLERPAACNPDRAREIGQEILRLEARRPTVREMIANRADGAAALRKQANTHDPDVDARRTRKAEELEQDARRLEGELAADDARVRALKAERGD